jgi:hypothetical protein
VSGIANAAQREGYNNFNTHLQNSAKKKQIKDQVDIFGKIDHLFKS